MKLSLGSRGFLHIKVSVVLLQKAIYETFLDKPPLPEGFFLSKHPIPLLARESTPKHRYLQENFTLTTPNTPPPTKQHKKRAAKLLFHKNYSNSNAPVYNW